MLANQKLGLSSGNDTDYDKDVDFEPSKDSTTKLLETWWKGQVYLNTFWKVWKDEYLLSLLVKDDNFPKAAWELGKITDLVRDQDGRVQSAEVLLPGHTIISRATNYLYPLEMPIYEKKAGDNP